MSQLRIGVMGCSSFASRAMVPAMIECDAVELVAVASRTAQKAEAFAQKFSCAGVEGYDALLDREDVDAVYMPLPTGMHEEWVSKALEAKKHVLVEKSFAPTAEAARSMTSLARSKNLLVLENYLFPHHAQHAWVEELVARGEIGELQLVRSTFGFPPLPKDNFRYNKELGGGALLDTGGYVVKAAQLFLGPNLTLRGAALRYDGELGVDIYGDAMFENETRQIAQVSFGFDYFYQCHYELLGTRGKLRVERAFTPPPGFRPRAVLEQQDLRREFTLAADNHYLNMVRFFAEETNEPAHYPKHWDALERQSELLDAIRKEGE